MKTILTLLLGAFVSVYLATVAARAGSIPDATKGVSGGGGTVKVTYSAQTEHESRWLEV